MTATAEEILKQLRASPVAERLRVAERIIHETAEEVTPGPRAAAAARPRDVLQVLDALLPGTEHEGRHRSPGGQ